MWVAIICSLFYYRLYNTIKLQIYLHGAFLYLQYIKACLFFFIIIIVN